MDRAAAHLSRYSEGVPRGGEMSAATPGETTMVSALLDFEAVAAILGRRADGSTRTYLGRLEGDGMFPSRRQASPNRVFWVDDDEKSDEGRPYAFQKKLTAPKTPAPRAAGRSFGSAPGPRRQRSPDPVSAGGRASATTSRPATRTPAKPCPRFPAFRAEALASNSFSANLRRHHSASTQATGLHRSPRGRDCREAIGCPGTVRSRINPPGPDRRLRASR